MSKTISTPDPSKRLASLKADRQRNQAAPKPAQPKHPKAKKK
jgi:hypothetical protein